MITKIDNIYLLGTSHVSKESSKEIEEAIISLKPEVVGIELDYPRLKGLLNPSKKKPKLSVMIREFGAFGAMFAMFAGSMQRRVAQHLGVEAGIDMKQAYLSAREHKIPTALIDQNVRVTLKKFSNMKFTKKVSTAWNLLTQSFKKEYRQKMNFDIKKGVPSNEKLLEILSIVKKEAPAFYTILIHERNIIMSKKLLDLKKKHSGPILAVVGAGHVEGMMTYLRKELGETKRVSQSFSFVTEVEPRDTNIHF
jgi:pheromone shutdown-related protein TraB